MIGALVLATLFWGPHPVGFTVGYARDVASSRVLDGKPRPIQMSFWYPAKRGGGGAMKFRDYVQLMSGERGTTTAEGERAVVEEYTSFLRETAKMAPPDVERWLDRPMRAVPGAPPLDGPSPLVLVAQGNGQSAADQGSLCELLASHGFAVATSPSPTRLGATMRSDLDVPIVAREQALDLEAIARMARTLSHVDRRKTAIVSHSFGARSALLYAMHHPVAAFVSLDGGIGSNRGTKELRSSPLFDASRVTSPLLHVYEDLDPAMAPDFSLFRSFEHADRFIVRASHLHHIHFSSINDGIDAFPALARATSADAETARTYEEVVRLTVAFLEASLAGSPQTALAKLGGGLELKNRWPRSVREK